MYTTDLLEGLFYSLQRQSLRMLNGLDVLTAYYRYQPEEVSFDGQTPRLDFILKFSSLKRGCTQAISLTYPHINIKLKKKE